MIIIYARIIAGLYTQNCTLCISGSTEATIYGSARIMGSLIRFAGTTLYIEFLVPVIQRIGKMCYFLLGKPQKKLIF